MSTVVFIILFAIAGALGLIGIIFNFVGKIVEANHDVTKIKTQKEILELEIQKQNIHLKLLEEENKKYDKIINEK